MQNQYLRDIAREAIALGAIMAGAFLLHYSLVSGVHLSGHEDSTHLKWFHQFSWAVRSGIVVPDWLPYLNNGAGSATFLFYPPLMLYMAFAASFFTKNLWAILDITAASGLAVSAITMYVLCRVFFSRKVSVACSLTYMGLPYHLLDTYYRTAMAESWAMAWLPLTFYFALRAHGRGRAPLPGLALSYALLCISHPPTVLIFTPFLLALVAERYMKERSAGTLIARLAALSLGVGLAAFYLAPAMLEQKNVHISMLQKLHFYGNNFIFSTSAWDVRFTHQVGMTTLAAACLLLAFFAVHAAARSKEGPSPWRGLALLAGISGMASVLLSFSFSDPVWRMLPMLQKIQFPWRFMSPAVFFASLCLGFSMAEIGRPDVPRIIKALLSLALGAAFLWNAMLSYDTLKGFRGMPINLFRMVPALSIRTDSSYEDLYRFSSTYQPGSRLSDVREYSPRWALLEKRLIYPEWFSNPVQAGRLTADRGRVSRKAWEPAHQVFGVQTAVADKAVLRTFYYPGWRAQLNGKPVDIEPEPETGLITLAVPQGESTVELWFEKGPYRKAGIAVSLASLALTLLILAYRPRYIQP